MRRLHVKTASERNLEAKKLLEDLHGRLEEIARSVNYLRNNFDDVFDPNKMKDLFDAQKEIDKLKKKI